MGAYPYSHVPATASAPNHVKYITRSLFISVRIKITLVHQPVENTELRYCSRPRYTRSICLGYYLWIVHRYINETYQD